MKYLWDTNTVIYYLHQQFPASAESFIDEVVSNGEITISVITEIELLCWKSAEPSNIQVLQSFLEVTRIIELDKAIKLHTADIRKATNLKLPDAIIAATAVVKGLTLLTNNVRDFKRVDSLRFINPLDA